MVASVERAPPTIAERFAAVEGELRQAEQLFRAHGMRGLNTGHPDETAHLQRQSLIGAMMVTSGDKLLQVERARIEQQGEGLTAADKARKLDDLRRAILRTAAKRELAVREIEADDFLVRPVHPELVIRPRAYLEQLAR